VAVEVKQVEGVIRERVLGAFFKTQPADREAGSSLLVEDDHFAIEDRAVDGELGGGFGNVTHPMRQSRTTAREEARPAFSVFCVDMDLDAIAVQV